MTDYRRGADFCPLSKIRGAADAGFPRRPKASHLLQVSIDRKREENPNFMVNYLELPVGDKSPEVINAVIEIPLEGINKYEYDKELHIFRLDRNLYSPVHYPGDYGFIPSTL